MVPATANAHHEPRQAQSPCGHPQTANHKIHVTRDDFRPLIERVWRLGRWRERDPRTPAARKRIRHRKACARNARTRVRMRRMARKKRRAFRRHRREQLAIRSHTPYDCGSHGHFAIPCSIVACESGYNFRARNPSSTAGGAYQIIDSTWYAYGGSRYSDSHPAAVAPPSEQHVVARRVWNGQGRGAWVC